MSVVVVVVVVVVVFLLVNKAVGMSWKQTYILYLHDAIPVVSSCNTKQRQKGHAEVAEVRVFVKAFARILQRTFYTSEWHVSRFTWLTASVDMY